tara:strand:+ start:77 stop:874 length:798 start_codon:yes stop_codon:yes gene_type:complete
MSGPPRFVIDEFDKSTALFFAKLSGASYYTPKAFTHFLRKEEIIDHLHYQFLDKNGSQAYILWDQETFIVSFRGTQPKEMKDVFNDMKFWKRPAWEGGKVHTGFASYVDEIWDDVKKLFFEHGVNPKTGKTKKVYLTGHSLGAAAATIAASRLGTFATACFTYGSPRTGNRTFVKTIKCPVWRFRNQRDLVTRVPWIAMNFKHVGKFCYIDRKHELRVGAVKHWRLFKDSIASIFNRTVADGFVDHAMSDYTKYIEQCDTVHKKD